MDKAKKTFAINALRRASYRHYGRYNALKRYKLGRNEYFCNACGWVSGKKDFQLDHIISVVPVSGWDGFDGFIDRLFCEPDGYQLLCKSCHQVKSAEENALRPAGDRSKSSKKKK
jgi:5-methylcytosine-specific restriction endonuclease McrA